MRPVQLMQSIVQMYHGIPFTPVAIAFTGSDASFLAEDCVSVVVSEAVVPVFSVASVTADPIEKPAFARSF